MAVALEAQGLALGSGGRTVFGVGSIAGLAGAVRELGGSRVFLVTDRGLAAAGFADPIRDQLKAEALEVRCYSELDPNPASGDIAAGAKALREFGTAVVVGLGGGTAIDSAKGISLAAANDVSIRELDYRNPLPNPGLPVIAVPTTAGTGSETNSFAVVEDHEIHRKFYIGNASVTPRVAILDPALTTGLPPGPTAATGMDALTHALESLLARNGNPFASALDLEVIRIVNTWLPVAVEAGDDLEGRSQLLLAAHMAGLAFATTGLGLCHALGHTLSALLGTPHGVALAATLPSVLKLNLPARGAELRRVAAALGVAAEADPGAPEAAIATIRSLARRVGMPGTLGELGLSATMVDELVKGSLEDVVLANNPVQPSALELAALVRDLL